MEYDRKKLKCWDKYRFTTNEKKIILSLIKYNKFPKNKPNKITISRLINTLEKLKNNEFKSELKRRILVNIKKS